MNACAESRIDRYRSLNRVSPLYWACLFINCIFGNNELFYDCMNTPLLNDRRRPHLSLTCQLQFSGDRLKGFDDLADIVDQTHRSKVCFVELFWHVPWTRHRSKRAFTFGIYRIYIIFYVMERRSGTYTG